MEIAKIAFICHILSIYTRFSKFGYAIASLYIIIAPICT